MQDQPAPPEAQLYPSHQLILAIPNDPALKRAYEAYKPSAETLQLLSEQNRTIYSELFIENGRLGTLKDLSTVAAARYFGPSPPPHSIAESPLLSQVYYDALDVDLALEKCHHITDQRYLKRVVLVKHHDKTLAIKRNINWKNLGVTLKLVELLEQCPVEYWPEDEITQLALNVKEFVKEMHIKRLQSLRELSFRKYFLTDSEEESSETSETIMKENGSQLGDAAQLKSERQALKEAKQTAREKRAAKRERREAKPLAKENPEKNAVKKIPYNMFDIKVSDSEDEAEERIVDKRNKHLYLKHIKKYNYPAHDCHHINLKFVQHLTDLETFVLEFWGPLQGRYFHQRHHRFSLNDINNLSLGLSHLSRLKVFRLRNSSMDAGKLQTLCQALALLPGLETLDFGFDQLNDDCGFIFGDLFKATKTLQSLELESNFLGEQSLQHIGAALNQYNATELLYLGLARNPLTDQALHALITQIVATTNHVQNLNIRGVTFVSERGICCCLANELLRKHSPLIKLDICALPVSPLAADEIVKSLAHNKTILEIYCTDCGLDLETEIDIKVLLQRNQYILDHYYLGDATVTTEEITKWLNRTRNPILLKVLAERDTHQKCLENTSDESKTYSFLKTPASSRQPSLDIKTQIYETNLEQSSSSEMQVVPAESSNERFVYPADGFNEDEFLAHVYQPGPQERYYYFKAYKQKYAIKDNIQNVSTI